MIVWLYALSCFALLALPLAIALTLARRWEAPAALIGFGAFAWIIAHAGLLGVVHLLFGEVDASAPATALSLIGLSALSHESCRLLIVSRNIEPSFRSAHAAILFGLGAACVAWIALSFAGLWMSQLAIRGQGLVGEELVAIGVAPDRVGAMRLKIDAWWDRPALDAALEWLLTFSTGAAHLALGAWACDRARKLRRSFAGLLLAHAIFLGPLLVGPQLDLPRWLLALCALCALAFAFGIVRWRLRSAPPRVSSSPQ